MVCIPDTFTTQLVQFLHGLKKVGNGIVLLKNIVVLFVHYKFLGVGTWSELQTSIQMVGLGS